MRKIKVDSTAINEIGYDSRRRVVEVSLHDGSSWRYKGVTAGDYYKLLTSKSLGKAYNDFKFHGYDYERIK